MQHIAVHVTPKAQRNEVVGVTTNDAGKQEVHVRVRAVPEGGKATKAVCETVAKSLGIAKSGVKVVRGDTSRHKLLSVDLSAEQIAQWMEGL